MEISLLYYNAHIENVHKYVKDCLTQE